jgi:hypothetical protein
VDVVVDTARTDAELERVRKAAREISALRLSDNVLIARAAERANIILMDLLTEIAPFEFLGPWQQID